VPRGHHEATDHPALVYYTSVEYLAHVSKIEPSSAEPDTKSLPGQADQDKHGNTPQNSSASARKEPVKPREPSVVIVVVGSGESGLAVDAEDIPRIWTEIRPRGFYIPKIKTPWEKDRTLWIGELLTGVSDNPLHRDGSVWKFGVPTIFDLFRRISGASVRDCWFIGVGETQAIIYDFMYVRTLMKKGKTKLEVSQNLLKSLTPGKLHLEIEFDDKEVQEFLKDVVAEHGGQTCNSISFVTRLGIRLLKSKEMKSRLTVFRFSSSQGDQEAKGIEDRRLLLSQKVREDDEACYKLWCAFQSNLPLKESGTFIVLTETLGAFIVGPRVKCGMTDRVVFLNQFAATIADLLGFKASDFTDLSPLMKKTPISEIFKE
jgi:hypothetical protein